MSNIPKLRFPEFKGEWEEKRIQDFAECCAGATPDTKKDEYWIDGTIPWMSSGEVNNTFIYSTEKKITQLGYDKTSTKLLPSNTVVIALAGQGKTRGTVAITRIELCTNQSLCAVLPDINLNSEYLFYFLSSQYKQLRNSSTGGDDSRGGLNLKIIGNFRLPYTTLAEQQKIADFLSNVDSIITAETKILNTLKKKKKALMQKLFTQQLRFKSDYGIDFPAWEEKKLGEIAIFSKGNGYSKSDLVSNGTPIILYGRLYTKYETSISEVDTFVLEKKNSVISKGDEIIVPASGETAEDISRASVVKHAGIILGGDLNIIEVDLNHYIPEFIALCISNGEPKKRMAKLAQGKTIVHLHNSDLQQLIFSIPCKEEQQKIADCLSSLDSLIQTQQKVVTTWQQRKKALLQQMFV